MNVKDVVIVAAVLLIALALVRGPLGGHHRTVLLNATSSINRKVVITDEGDNIREMRFCDPPCVRQARIKVGDPTYLGLEYTKRMVSGFAFLEKEAKRILILGYGGGNIGNFLLTMFPKAHIDMIEHDPVVMNATLHFMYHHSPHQANFSLLTGDARIWMEQNREKYCNIYATWARVTEELEAHKYDVVISDACASPCELVSLETFEFIHNCLLKREGVLIQNMFGWNLDLRLLRNMQLIFGEGLFVIDTPEKTPNTILVGKKMLDSKAFSFVQILNRAKWFSIRHKNLSFDILDILKHAVHAARPIVNAELFTDLDSLNERKK